jgi:nucleotide-binding universal stress UspA family protein
MTGFTRILVPIDFSAASDAALVYAKGLAERFGASLHLVHAFENPFTAAAFASGVYSNAPLALGEKLLGEVQKRLADRFTADEAARFGGTAVVVTGPPAGSIVEHAKTVGVDLIVMGTHGHHGLTHVLLGSVAERVVRTAPCPVLTLRDTPLRALRHILVPTDFSATADAALAYAFALAAPFGADVQLLHVLDDPFIGEGMTGEAYIAEAPLWRGDLLQAAQSRLNDRRTSPNANVAVHGEVVFGDGARTITEYAALRDIDLIVMGTHGRTGVAHLLIGSVAERVVRTSPCPVFTVRQAPTERVYTELVYQVDRLPA